MTTPLHNRSELNASPATGLADLADLDDEAPARRQPGQLIEVFLDGQEPFTVRVVNPDRIAFERVRASRKWPAPAEAQSLAMTFVTWNAAKRAGSTTLTYEQWEQALMEWETVEDTPADPTR